MVSGDYPSGARILLCSFIYNVMHLFNEAPKKMDSATRKQRHSSGKVSGKITAAKALRTRDSFCRDAVILRKYDIGRSNIYF